MPIDAVWIVATIPQKSFEQTLISFNSKLSLEADAGKQNTFLKIINTF